MASADWFTASGVPVTDSDVLSPPMRNEFLLIEAATDKLPVLTGNGGKFVKVNGSGTSLEAITPSVETGKVRLNAGDTLDYLETKLITNLSPHVQAASAIYSHANFNGL